MIINEYFYNDTSYVICVHHFEIEIFTYLYLYKVFYIFLFCLRIIDKEFMKVIFFCIETS